MGDSAIPFCPACGAILELLNSQSITCQGCTYQLSSKELSKCHIVTGSMPNPPPRWYLEASTRRQQEQGAVNFSTQTDSRATINEPCPRCNHPEQSFYTMQLRSADEGSTIFYECMNSLCRHKYSATN